MTGPERLELASSMGFVRDALERIEGKVDGLDNRVQKIELVSAQQMGVAAGTAAAVATNDSRNERRAIGNARAIAVAASIASIIGILFGVAMQVVHF